MKIWPIVALSALLYGGMYADALNVPREAKPHARGHFEPDLGPIPSASFVQPHRPVTFYRVLFAQLLAQEGVDWTAPDSDAKTVAEADHILADGDPGKKLFWHTVWNPADPTPFPGWFDPNPNPDPQFPVYAPSQFTGVGDNVVFETIDTVAHEGDVAEQLSTHIQGVGEGLTGEQIKALDNLTLGAGGVVKLMPCETVVINGVCLMPCKPNDPLCKDDNDIPPGLKPPVITGPDPPVIGGGIGSGGPGPIFGGGGPGPTIGGVPEPSTWALTALGFALIGAIGWWRKRLA